MTICYNSELSITHNTIRPYFLSLCLFCVALMEVTTYLVSLHFFFPNDWQGFTNFMRNNFLFRFLTVILINLKFTFALVSIMQRTYEHNTLYFFIMYQRAYKLQELPLAKDAFQKQELRHERIFRVGAIILVLPLLLLAITPILWISLEPILLLSVIYFTLMLVLTSSIYFSTVINLILEMKQLHHLEY